MTEAKAEILARIVRATGAEGGVASVPRAYRTSTGLASAELADLLADRLEDYRGEVVRCAGGDDAIARVLGAELVRRGLVSVVAPLAAAEAWLGELATGERVQVVVDGPELTPDDLDGVAAVVTGAAVAVAETGVVVLDGGPWCGRRAISLVPDVHLCVVRTAQVVGLPGEALAGLDPRSPQTWIAGPSATSDIELDRVEGVHGPRTLVVVLAG